jgi:hypothetical protein
MIHSCRKGAVHDDDKVGEIYAEGHFGQGREEPVTEDELRRIVPASKHGSKDAEVHPKDEEHPLL